jgi:hypothetical protein
LIEQVLFDAAIAIDRTQRRPEQVQQQGLPPIRIAG